VSNTGDGSDDKTERPCPYSPGAIMRRITRLCLLISVGLHLLFILLWNWPGEKTPAPMPDEWNEQQERGLVFELIEVPESVPEEQPDAATNLVSDRETRAADRSLIEPDTPADPNSEGAIEIVQYEQAEQPDPSEAGAEPAPPDLPELGEVMQLVDVTVPESGVDYLEEMRAGKPDRRSAQAARYENPSTAAARRGGLSFNTYNWDFAPYMLAMKRKVESNLHPPYAFTHMGAVSGTNMVRFTVLPDGRIRDVAILGSDAHFSLDQSSIRAIQLSAPFLPLPSGFPEDYLEVTAHFSYLIQGRE
jgi:TonB family protein